MSAMRFLSLCSGIEAASVAWLPLGWQAVAYSEIEPFACAVLAHHYPDVPNLGDMTKVLDWRPYAGTVNIVVAGTPCQDFSVAGKRAGLAGERSGLALVFVQVLSIVRPEWFVWENVPGVFSTNGGRDFGTFLRALDDIGYSCAWRVLDAQYFGVPQRRRRVFLVGHLGDWRPAAAVLFEPHCLRGDTAPRRKAAENVAGTITASAGRSGGKETDLSRITQVLAGRMGGGGPDDNKAQGGFYVPQPYETANTLTRRMFKGVNSDLNEGQTPVISQYGNKAEALPCEGADASPCADRGPTVIASPTQVRRPTPRECERLQGFPDDYTAIPYRRPFGNLPKFILERSYQRYLRRMARQGKQPLQLNDLIQCADGPRYRVLGNSMAVPVMRWIGERIERAILRRGASA